MNYSVHLTCESYLSKEWNHEVIPIQDNIIHFLYLFLEEKQTLNYDYICLNNGRNLKKAIDVIDNWSIVFYYKKIEYDELDDLTKYLFLKLSSTPIIFISVFSI